MDDGASSGRDVSVHAPALAPDLAPGARVGRYLIIERVGTGAMGVVFGAYDPELDRKIALKLLKAGELEPGDTSRARLLREAKATARLAHPNVIAVHDVGVFDGRVFLAMEFLGGGTLRSWLAGGRRDLREVVKVFAAAGRGLAAAHEAGLVHRDFKPENVLLDREGRPRVVDFGLAREAAAAVVVVRDAAAKEAAAEAGAGADMETGRGAGGGTDMGTERNVVAEVSSARLDTLTRTGAVLGTPAYMAPEQFLDEPTDQRTDQFSFCVALYEALYGVRPFTGDSVLQLVHNIAEAALQPVPEHREVPAWIRRAVMRGLQSDPARRWPSMAPLIAALEDDPAARRRSRLLAGGGLAVLIAVVVVVAQIVRHRRQEMVGSSRVDLQACKLEYSIVSPK